MTETTTNGTLVHLTSANSGKPTGARTPADALGVTKRMTELDGDSQEPTECPKCGRSDFSTRQGMKVHHKRIHNERLVDEQKVLRERFEEKYERGPPDECWEWIAATQGKGYGRIKVGGRHRQAHRVSYELEHGPIPEGMWILHHCDNMLCVNPSHLYPGTHADNVQDAVDRNRTPRGTDNGDAKLTPEEVREIKKRAKNESQRTVADEFDIDQSTVSLIVNGKLWPHVD